MSTSDNSHEQANHKLMDEAEKLIWAYLDEMIEENDAKRLEKLLQENEDVRKRYLNCAQIHADLYEHLRVGKEAEVQSPVLGSLGSFSSSAIDVSSMAE